MIWPPSCDRLQPHPGLGRDGWMDGLWGSRPDFPVSSVRWWQHEVSGIFANLNQQCFRVEGYTGCGPLAAGWSGIKWSRRCTFSIFNSSDGHQHHCGPSLGKLIRFDPFHHINIQWTSWPAGTCSFEEKAWCCYLSNKNGCTFDPSAAG